MRLADYTDKLLDLARTVHRWLDVLPALDDGRREKVARYAEQIADTLARAAQALGRLEAVPRDRRAARQAVREFGRIAGYVETIVAALDQHLDGRKLAGIKRRLEQLADQELPRAIGAGAEAVRIHPLLAAEGYFRALADALRI